MEMLWGEFVTSYSHVNRKETVIWFRQIPLGL